MSILQKSKEGLILFCACIEGWKGSRYVATTRYMEAPDLVTAKANFALMIQKGQKIIEVAPVIGYHVQDNHGDKLIT